MNTKFKRILILGAIAMLLFSATTACAQGGGTKHKQQHRDNLIEELALTPEQQAQFEEQRSEHRRQMKETHAALQDKRLQLQAELEKSVSDKNKIDTLAFELKSLQAQLIDLRIDGIVQTKTILTPEQFAKFKEKVSSRRKRGRKSEKGPAKRRF